MAPEARIIKCLLCECGTLESDLEVHIKYNHLIYKEAILKVIIIFIIFQWQYNYVTFLCSFYINYIILQSTRKLFLTCWTFAKML